MLNHDEWQIIKLHSIPTKQNNAFVAKILDKNIVLQQREQIMQIDDKYLLDFCRNTPIRKICKQTQPIHIDKPENCKEKCAIAIFQIDDLTFIPLTNQYIVIPKEPVEIHALCDTESRVTIKTNSLITSTQDCTLFYNNEIMKLSGSTKSANITYSQNSLNITTELLQDNELYNLHLPVLPKITHNIENYQTDLDQMEASLAQLKHERRIHSLKENFFNALSYIGYASMGIIVLYSLYRCGLFKYLPRTLCIKICCNENQINTVTQPNAEPTVHYHATATEEDLPPAYTKETTLSPVQTPHRRKVQFLDKKF